MVFEDQRLSYRELNQRANQLAHMLISRGVGPEEMVGICLERSLEMVVGLLGVLKAGAAYLPLDPDYPKERLAFMLQDAEPVCVVTTERTQRCLPDNPTRILLENLGTVEQQGKTHNPHNGDRTRPLFLHNPAYVIYTSGSTGRPKGVVVTHGGVINRIAWMQSAYVLTSDDRVLHKTPYSFDVSVWEFFWFWTAGAALIVAQPRGHWDPKYLANLIVREHVTITHFVPSMLNAFLREPGLDSLRGVATGNMQRRRSRDGVTGSIS